MGRGGLMTWEGLVQMLEEKLDSYDLAVQETAKGILLKRLKLEGHFTGQKN